MLVATEQVSPGAFIHQSIDMHDPICGEKTLLYSSSLLVVESREFCNVVSVLVSLSSRRSSRRKEMLLVEHTTAMEVPAHLEELSPQEVLEVPEELSLSDSDC